MYNLHSVLKFGKHKDKPIWVVVICDPTYFDWCIKAIDDFCIESLEELETLPLYNSLSKNPDVISQMRQKIALHPELFQSKIAQPQRIEDFFTEKGYAFYSEHFKPILTKCHKFKSATIALNNAKIIKIRNQDMRNESEGINERYTFDDTINDAFEGDYSNYWNID